MRVLSPAILSGILLTFVASDSLAQRDPDPAGSDAQQRSARVAQLRQQILRALDAVTSLDAGGSTNFYDGLETGLLMASALVAPAQLVVPLAV